MSSFSLFFFFFIIPCTLFILLFLFFFFFFFNDTATTEIYTLSLHDALPIFIVPLAHREAHAAGLRHFLATGEGPILNQRIELTALRRDGSEFPVELAVAPDRKSTRLNSSHLVISYAVFCLKKKKQTTNNILS